MERLTLDGIEEPLRPAGAPLLELPPDPPEVASGSVPGISGEPHLAVGTGTLARVEPAIDPSERARELAELEIRFEKCLARVNMHFRPIVHADRQLFGYESLLRSTDKSLPHPGAILDA